MGDLLTKLTGRFPLTYSKVLTLRKRKTGKTTKVAILASPMWGCKSGGRFTILTSISLECFHSEGLHLPLLHSTLLSPLF
ncbi:hypothetical protein Tco_0668601 [Tanacetum coccineum]